VIRREKKTDSLMIRISPQDKQLMQDIAAYNNISVSNLIVALLHDLAQKETRTIKMEYKLGVPKRGEVKRAD
jgi:uncharacterized protein (DUF1778 family)